MSTWEGCVLLLFLVKITVISSNDCNGNTVSVPKTNRIPGCLHGTFMDKIVKSQLSEKHSFDVLTDGEAAMLINAELLHEVPKIINKYNKAVEKFQKGNGGGTLTAPAFDLLSRVQASLVCFVEMEFKNGKNNDWETATVEQNWDDAKNELENMLQKSKDDEQEKRLIEAIQLLENDDGSTCCDGGVMHEGHCYFLVEDAKSVQETRSICNSRARGILNALPGSAIYETEDTSIVFADLVSLHGEAGTGMLEKLQGTHDERVWVGAFDCSVETNKDEFLWADGNPVTQTELSQLFSAASSQEGEFDCAVYYQSKLHKHSCADTLPFVCELSMPVGSKADAEINQKELNEAKKKSRKNNGAVAPIVENCNSGSEFAGCDIRLRNDEQMVSDTSSNGKPSRKRRNVVAEQFRYLLWTNGIVPFEIDPDANFAPEEIVNITEAIKSINSWTCIRMINHTEELQYVLFTRNYYGTFGCWSYIGKADPFGPGPFPINLGAGCTMIGTIQHEIMHTLGFVHEHTRADRDDYVKILLENVNEGSEHNFAKYGSEHVQHMEHSYDYDSILHYGAYSLSRNDLPTIVPLRPTNTPIGQRYFMTDNDIAEMNNLYNCQVPIHGSWAYWSNWDDCSEPCGGGVRLRSRDCTLPYPKYGGNECVGSPTQSIACNTDACSEDYYWAGCWKYTIPANLHNINGDYDLENVDPSWTNFTELCGREAQQYDINYFAIMNDTCFVFDGSDSMAATAIFQDPSDNCNGRGSEDSVDVFKIGNEPMQANYGPWQAYSLCSKSCEGGTKSCTRVCNNPPVRPGTDDLPCVGEDTDTVTCNEQMCPVDGGWSEWSEWSDCSLTCGVGNKVRERLCDNPPPAHGGYDCDTEFGGDEHITACNTGICPVVDGCPLIHNTDYPEAYEHYEFASKDRCDDGGIAGAVSALKPHTENVELVEGTGENAGSVTFGPKQNLLAVIPGLKPCLIDPDKCYPGFGIQSSIKKFATHAERLRRKRSTDPESGERTMVLFSTGVNTDSDSLASESKGISIYFAQDGNLRATVLTQTTRYTVDLPGDLFEEDTFRDIYVHWSKEHGLWIAFEGFWYDRDQQGYEHQASFSVEEAETFSVGGPPSCQTDQYFSGYLRSLTIYDNVVLNTTNPFPNKDFNCDLCNSNADCTGKSCDCKSGYEGDGIFHCTQTDTLASNVPSSESAYKWPEHFEVVYTSDVPSFQGDVLKASNVVRSKSVVFNGLRDYIHGGDDSECYKDPSKCVEGVAVAFTMVYFGRGDHYNFIFSTGAMPWYPTTGMSMYVKNGMATVQVQTLTTLNKVEFPVDIGSRQRYLVSWQEITGLTVYVDSHEYNGRVIDSAGSPNFYGSLMIGKPSLNNNVYNGRFEMEDFHFWEISATPVLF